MVKDVQALGLVNIRSKKKIFNEDHTIHRKYLLKLCEFVKAFRFLIEETKTKDNNMITKQRKQFPFHVGCSCCKVIFFHTKNRQQNEMKFDVNDANF